MSITYDREKSPNYRSRYDDYVGSYRLRKEETMVEPRKVEDM